MIYSFYFPWEISCDLVKDGASLRTCGRLTDYLPEESKAILTSHHASVQYQVSVQTTFVEPFDPIIGAQYIVLGEVEKSEGDGEAIVRARVFNCVDGVDVALLQKAVNEQRKFFRERNETGAYGNINLP
ncbi:CST complex subunit TEN1 isoform X2 [Clarias gariepinus]|uniref:CST complex subunit TEN1 isoform X2 n=1 Tax=Clarias gariepinus TaxID=13013 RepID=UPI00234D60BC|nr:CST complex subunit TEN1 isoform X2 [Clarias gariepinus]